MITGDEWSMGETAMATDSERLREASSAIGRDLSYCCFIIASSSSLGGANEPMTGDENDSLLSLDSESGDIDESNP